MPRLRGKVLWGLAAILALGLLAAACSTEGGTDLGLGSDETTTTSVLGDTASTTVTGEGTSTSMAGEDQTTTSRAAETTSTVAEDQTTTTGVAGGDQTTTSMGGEGDVGDLDSLLLTEAEVGGSWVAEQSDVPKPDGIEDTGLLCPAGQAIIDDAGFTYEPQAWAVFAPEGMTSADAYLSETLAVDQTGEEASGFRALVQGLEACAAAPPEGDAQTVQMLEAPDLGDDAYHIAITPGTAGSEETHQYGYRVGQYVVMVSAVLMGGSDQAVSVNEEDLLRIIRAAVAKVEAGAGK